MIRLSSASSALNMKQDSALFFAKGGLLSASSFIWNFFTFSEYSFRRAKEILGSGDALFSKSSIKWTPDAAVIPAGFQFHDLNSFSTKAELQ